MKTLIALLRCEMVMKDFFKKYPPDSFTLVKKGSTDALSLFAIFNYQSGARQFQVCIDMKKTDNRYLILKIKFEEKK